MLGVLIFIACLYTIVLTEDGNDALQLYVVESERRIVYADAVVGHVGYEGVGIIGGRHGLFYGCCLGRVVALNGLDYVHRGPCRYAQAAYNSYDGSGTALPADVFGEGFWACLSR